MVYKELWYISAIKHVNFSGSDGQTVDGYQVFYSRSLYDNENKDIWYNGRACPSKPQWLTPELHIKLIEVLEKSKNKFLVFAQFTPQGRYNALSGFEACND